MAVVIILDNQEDRLALKKLISEAVHEELQSATADNEAIEAKDRMLIDQVAEFLGISKSTIYKATCKRLLPHYKKGRKLYFSRKELQQWIAEGKRKVLREINY